MIPGAHRGQPTANNQASLDRCSPDKPVRAAIRSSGVPATLQYLHDGKKVTSFLLPSGCAIGRRPDKHLVCVSSKTVSPGHAWLELRDDGWWVSDLGSATGSFINDRRIMSGGLRNADVLRCGEVAFRFEETKTEKPALFGGLLCFSADGVPQTVSVHPEGCLLGTFPSATICAEDASVARLHAFVFLRENQFVVVPQTPGFPVTLNGYGVGEKGTQLRSEDVLGCGALAVRFVLLKEPIKPPGPATLRAQLRNCPAAISSLSVQVGSLLATGGSGLLGAPSGLQFAPTARLTLRDGSRVLQTVVIPENGAFLGRSVDCLLRSDDPSVPRRFGRVYFREGRWWFEDLGSSSPSLVNGQQQFPHIERELRSGDVIKNRAMEVSISIDGLLAHGGTFGFRATAQPAVELSGAQLLQISQDGETKLLPIPEGGAKLGRSRGCLLTTEDQSVSRQHASLTVDGEQAWVEDLSKEQGTWLGGRRLLFEKRPLHTGDLIRIGPVCARYVAKNASFATLDTRYRPFRVRCPIGRLGPVSLFWADHPELLATVVLHVLPPGCEDHARWLLTLTAMSRLLRVYAPADPSGGTLLRELPEGERLLAAPLGCGLLLTEFAAVFGSAPLPLAVELLGQLCRQLDRLTQTDPTRKQGQLPVRDVWLYTDPLAPLGFSTKLLPLQSGAAVRPSPILQAPETGNTNRPRHGQVYVYGLLLYTLATGNLPPFSAPKDKLLAELRSKLPPLLLDFAAEVLLENAERRPDPQHAQRWLAELRSLYAQHN